MQIVEAVQSFINHPQPERFESLALAVFRYQAERVPAYRRWLGSLGIDPAGIDSLDRIPPASTVAFKYARIESTLQPESPDARVFLTSGTTGGSDGRGRHIVPGLGIYRASAVGHLRRMMFPDGARLAMLALHPTVDRMPESSLAQMISWCIDEFGNGDALCTATREALDSHAAIEFLLTSTRTAAPVCILGTTASCAALFEAMRELRVAVGLPAGSRLMDTGGAKGQRIPLLPEQVAVEAQALLGIPAAMVINEYGMTEMCSQLYDATSFNSDAHFRFRTRMKIAPPWLKPMAFDPLTLTAVKDGEPGLLGFFDLANVGSISALMTEDIGIVDGDAVLVLGRAAAADIRGCALAIEEFARAEDSLRASSNGDKDAKKVGWEAVKQERLGSIDIVGGRSTEAGQVLPAASFHGHEGTAITAAQIKVGAARLREAIIRASPDVGPEQSQAVFDGVVESITGTSRPQANWGEVIQGFADRASCTQALVERSLAALVHPLKQAGATMARLKARRELIGLIAPGNIPGAGLHEVVLALLSGCAVIVKTSVAEPRFFKEFATTLRRFDAQFGSDFGARMEVFNWGRERTDLSETLLDECDRVLALGDDDTIAELKRRDPQVMGFNARVSGAAIARRPAREALAATAMAVALDCTLFDQRGCLSPHHVFVEDRAREFASEMAAALSRLDMTFGSGGIQRRVSLEDGIGVRRVRSIARWRAIGGREVALWEDPNFRWTVVFDRLARFTPSPGLRTVFVSPFRDVADLRSRLEPVRGRLEAFALATENFQASDPEDPNAVRRHQLATVLQDFGASYICALGEMHSPPLDWPHGGGEFMRQMFQ